MTFWKHNVVSLWLLDFVKYIYLITLCLFEEHIHPPSPNSQFVYLRQLEIASPIFTMILINMNGRKTTMSKYSSRQSSWTNELNPGGIQHRQLKGH